jgi:hypothetical protein
MSINRTLGVLCLYALATQAWAQSTTSPAPSAPTAASDSATPGTNQSKDLQQLRLRLAKQEEAIKALQKSLDEQRALLQDTIKATAAAESASASAPAATGTAPSLQPVSNVANPVYIPARRQNLQSSNPSPLGIHIGNTTFTPLGFVDATFFGRTTNVGSGIGTNFGGIPYNTAAAGHLSETNFSTQNSRIGFRVDSTVLGAKVLGYFEADFLGAQPTNVFVTSNSDTFRMRNVFVDVEKDGFEILGGQDWSFATPNRKGLSPLPSDIFYTQNMDTNYQAGLVWARQTQFRFIGHPTKNIAYGVSLENPQQYIGGSGGLNGGSVTLPAALATALGTQFNNNGTGANFAVPNLHPDIIFKAAYDGHVGDTQIMHVEAGAIIRSFKLALPTAPFTTNSATAASGEVNANLGVTKNLKLIANTFFGSGNGRYTFGLAPDVIVRADGTISPIHTYSTVDGVEYNLTKNTLLSAYYGGVYIKRDTAVDLNGSLIGYGFLG